MPSEPVSVDAHGPDVPPDWASLRSPENYLGHERTANFTSPGGAALSRRRAYSAPVCLKLNHCALSGEWTMEKKAAVLNAPSGRIACGFHARNLHLVMGPSTRGQSVRFRALLDGKAAGWGAEPTSTGGGSAG